MESLTRKTIDSVPNIINLSHTEKRHFRLEPVEPMTIPEICAVLDGLKKLNKNFQFRISWG
jgi:hypothetical protein